MAKYVILEDANVYSPSMTVVGHLAKGNKIEGTPAADAEGREFVMLADGSYIDATVVEPVLSEIESIIQSDSSSLTPKSGKNHEALIYALVGGGAMFGIAKWRKLSVLTTGILTVGGIVAGVLIANAKKK
jgi:hypothetical protein